MDYILVGNKHDEIPTYLVSDATYAKSDSELLADMALKGIGAPVGTLVTKAGYKAIKQLGANGTFVTL